VDVAVQAVAAGPTAFQAVVATDLPPRLAGPDPVDLRADQAEDFPADQVGLAAVAASPAAALVAAWLAFRGNAAVPVGGMRAA
jgi:hypothetical protein